MTSRDDRDPAWLGRLELALWERDDEAAGATVAEGLRWRATSPSGWDLSQHLSPWYALALRLAADQAERAAARQSADELVEIRRWAAAVAAELDQLATSKVPKARHPGILCNLLFA